MKPMRRRAAVSRGALPKILHRASHGPRKAGDDAQQRGLARAVAADQRQARIRRRVQADVAQGREIAIELPDALNRDGAHLLPGASLAIQQREAERQNAERDGQNRQHLRINPRQDLLDLRAAFLLIAAGIRPVGRDLRAGKLDVVSRARSARRYAPGCAARRRGR